MWRRYTYYIIGSICLMLTACDHIAESDRLYDSIIEDIEPIEGQEDDTQETVKRMVLLEDFTGQKCINCPNATKEIELIQELFPNKVAAVAIHGGSNGFSGNANLVGLATETAKEYYNKWGLGDTQPIGMVNRHEPPIIYQEWSATVKKELEKPVPLRLEGSAALADNTITIQIKAEGINGTVTGKLQVWLLEDGIKAFQKMPNGTINYDYIHNHVFRTAVNGTWGKDISLEEGKAVEQTMTQALDPNWNKEQLSIVAFVYNDDGVQQAAKFKVMTPNPL